MTLFSSALSVTFQPRRTEDKQMKGMVSLKHDFMCADVCGEFGAGQERCCG